MRIRKTLEVEIKGAEAALKNRLAESGLTVESVCKRANISRQTWYSVVGGDAAPVSLAVLTLICRALDTTPENLGVTFAPEPQKLRPIAEAKAGVPVLGVWVHHSRTDYLSCYRHKSGEWYLTPDTAMMTPMSPPGGFLDLPEYEVEQ